VLLLAFFIATYDEVGTLVLLCCFISSWLLFLVKFFSIPIFLQSGVVSLANMLHVVVTVYLPVLLILLWLIAAVFMYMDRETKFEDKPIKATIFFIFGLLTGLYSLGTMVYQIFESKRIISVISAVEMNLDSIGRIERATNDQTLVVFQECCANRGWNTSAVVPCSLCMDGQVTTCSCFLNGLNFQESINQVTFTTCWQLQEEQDDLVGPIADAYLNSSNHLSKLGCAGGDPNQFQIQMLESFRSHIYPYVVGTLIFGSASVFFVFVASVQKLSTFCKMRQKRLQRMKKQRALVAAIESSQLNLKEESALSLYDDPDEPFEKLLPNNDTVYNKEIELV